MPNGRPPTSEDAPEMGFLFLEDGEVVIDDGSDAYVTCGKWLDVLKPDQEMRQSITSSSSVARSRCSQCILRVKKQEGQESLAFFEGGPTFDGTVADTKPRSCNCSNKSEQRADSALLVGLALFCQDIHHIEIREIRLLVAQTTPDSTSNRDREDGRRRASIVITFSVPEIPEIPESGCIGCYKPNGQATSSRRFICRSRKVLPAPTQLLLSIMQSDWDFLATLMEKTTQVNLPSQTNQTSTKVSLFPSKLSLDEVYRRNRAAGFSFGLSTPFSVKKVPQPPSGQPRQAIVTDLPVELWKFRIAVFLRAKSVHSLRCTGKFFNEILQATVPGMKLRLYSHQIKSLRWMRLRETKAMTEGDLKLSPDEKACYPTIQKSGDIHRAASGGASVLLNPRRRNGARPFRISQESGEELNILDDPLSRDIARGGLLCDDPGLGKTITVLSLVLQTLGLTTEQDPKEVVTPLQPTHDVTDADIFAAYWKEQLIQDFRNRELLKFLSQLRKQNKEVDIFWEPVVPDKLCCPDYFDIVKKPICFLDIQQKIATSKYRDSFADFIFDMHLCLENAILYNPPNHRVYIVACRLKAIFDSNIESFKQQHVRVATKSFGRASAKPNSAVAAIVERSNRLRFMRSLRKSGSTLIAVPVVLLEHWQDQLRLHIDYRYISGKRPIVFEYTGISRKSRKVMRRIVEKCQVAKSHFPFMFVDKTSTKSLPDPEFLAMFTIVLVATQRFSQEWKNGSFQQELKENATHEYSDSDPVHASPLLKVHWLRIVVDEGHSMGRGKENAAIVFASWIEAERRWAMTGTPTRQTPSHTGLQNILNLLQFLKHEFFSRRMDGELVWQGLINRGWNRAQLSSFFRLRELLGLLMVRHTKLDIEELPYPVFKTTVLPMSGEEEKAYNTLVSAVQSNLLITSMQGKTSGAQDSLLHKSQAKHAKEALRNIRVVCAGGTQLLPTMSDKFRTEFAEDFQALNHEPSKLTWVQDYIQRATTSALSPCSFCGIMLQTLLVFPCGDLVCTECFDNRSNSCIVCDQEFDVDVFQLLQPGMDYQWLHNVQATRAKTPEQQPANTLPAAQDMVMPDGAGLLAPDDVERPRTRTRRPGDGHQCIYHPRRPGECQLCWEKHDSCVFDAANGTCKTCYMTAEECPDFESKNAYLIKSLSNLLKGYRTRTKENSVALNKIGEWGSTELPVKAIVFSQFRTALNTSGDRLLKKFGAGCVAEYWGKYRKQELHKFVYDPNCFCMLLGKDGSEGLDLSFVTHIFFLEQVWDKSLQQQAVARAWRMGAKGAVQVETLLAQHSVEESMAQYERSCEEETRLTMDYVQITTKSNPKAGSKLYHLLEGLRLITSNHAVSFGAVDPANKRPRAPSLRDETDLVRVKRLRRVTFASSA